MKPLWRFFLAFYFVINFYIGLTTEQLWLKLAELLFLCPVMIFVLAYPFKVKS